MAARYKKQNIKEICQKSPLGASVWSMTTTELIQNYYQKFNQGDRAGMLALLTSDVVHEVNQGSAEIGKDAFTKFMTRMDECYAEQVENLVVMPSADGKRVAAEFNIQGTYLKTDKGLPEARGQKYFIRVGAFFDVKESKIARVTNYYNLPGWIQAVK